MDRSKCIVIGFWTVTALFCLQIGFTAYAQLRLPQVAEAFTQLGFPDYFRVELSLAKLLGVVWLLAPVPARLLVGRHYVLEGAVAGRCGATCCLSETLGIVSFDVGTSNPYRASSRAVGEPPHRAPTTIASYIGPSVTPQGTEAERHGHRQDYPESPELGNG
jgi:hypothetical protein